MDFTNGTTYTISGEKVTIIGKMGDGRIILQSNSVGLQIYIAPNVMPKLVDKQ